MIKTRFILIVFCICSFGFCFGQKNDTLTTVTGNDTTKVTFDKKKMYTKPRIATIMSICLPGLGQAYNGGRSLIKIPIIYAGLGGFGYLFYTNNTHYYDYKNALILSQDPASQGYAVVDGRYWSTSQLQTQKLYYKKFRDFAIIGASLIYVLNIIDANVDAHLKTFDVSDDLSVNIDPWQGLSMAPSARGRIVTGISIKINFK